MAINPNQSGRGAKAGAFALEIQSRIVGYLKKLTLPKMTGELATNDGGPVSLQSKQITKMTWGPIKFDIGLGMSSEMYDWINATFKHNYQMRDGAILMMNENYDVIRRCDFTHAHMTEITIPALDAKGKEPMYLSCAIQPEIVRFSAGGGKATAQLGQNQKLYAATMFNVTVPGLKTENVSKIDSVKFEVKVTEDAVGKFIESRYVATKCSVPDLKLTINEVDSDPWYQKFFSYIQAGQREVKDQLEIDVQIMAPNASTPIATIEFKGCGPKEFSHPDRTANEDKVASVEATFFVEEIELKYNKKD